jgi:hypothetical protein
MHETFDCQCKSPSCLKHIRGAKYLTTEVRRRHRMAAHFHHLVADGGEEKAA